MDDQSDHDPCHHHPSTDDLQRNPTTGVKAEADFQLPLQRIT